MAAEDNVDELLAASNRAHRDMALAAASMTEVIVLPGATSAEGIAAGRRATFFAGDAFRGNIFRGDLQRGTAELFIEVP